MSRLRLFNGFLEAEEFYRDNGRAERLQAIGDGGWVTDLTEARVIRDHDYSRALLGEEIRFERPLLTRHLTLRLTGISGDYNSAAISELEFLGVAADGSG